MKQLDGINEIKIA